MLAKELTTHKIQIEQCNGSIKVGGTGKASSGRNSVSTTLTGLSDETLNDTDTGLSVLSDSLGTERWFEIRSNITMIPIE